MKMNKHTKNIIEDQRCKRKKLEKWNIKKNHIKYFNA